MVRSCWKTNFPNWKLTCSKSIRLENFKRTNLTQRASTHLKVVTVDGRIVDERAIEQSVCSRQHESTIKLSQRFHHKCTKKYVNHVIHNVSSAVITSMIYKILLWINLIYGYMILMTLHFAITKFPKIDLAQCHANFNTKLYRNLMMNRDGNRNSDRATTTHKRRRRRRKNSGYSAMFQII